MLNIGFYGASDAAWSGYSYVDKDSMREVVSWNDLVGTYFKANCVNKAVMNGSIERAAIEIKGTKEKLDIAIVVLGVSAAIPLVHCNRDIDAGHKDFEHTSDQIFNIHGVVTHPQYGCAKEVAKQFESQDEFVQTLNMWKKHLWSNELQALRYAGALMQLDQYLVAKNIPAIYCGKASRVPPWLTLQAGIVDDDLHALNKKYNRSNNLPNNISAVGQKELAKVYIKLIKEKLKI